MSKNYTQSNLIGANALGDDRNLIANGAETKEACSIKEQCIKEKLQGDLDKLGKIYFLINQSISAIGNSSLDTKNFLDDLSCIGRLINDISWDQDNKDCIRNKHGYRNRHKAEGNKKNKTGGKLDFETLAHLKNLAEDQEFQWLLTTDLNLVKDSLTNIQQKIYFILSKEFIHLDESSRSDVDPGHAINKEASDEEDGFIRKVSAYYHDRICITKLIELLEEIGTPKYQYLDLNNKIDRYWLGYLFTQIGEVAKEVSEFIKSEKYTTAEPNLTRFFFGKLGNYRQEIKNQPRIIYNINNTKLLQMKLMLEQAIVSDIVPFMHKIRKDLLDSLIMIDNAKGIDYAQTIVLINNHYSTIENIPQQSESLARFEKDSCQHLQNLTVILANGTKSDLTEKGDKYDSKLIDKLYGKLEQLNRNVEVLKQEEAKYTEAPMFNKEDSKIVIEQQGAVNQFIKQTCRAKNLSIEIKGLLNKLTNEDIDALKALLEDTQVELVHSIQNLVLAEPERVIKAGVNLVDITVIKIKKYEQDIIKAKKQFFNKCKSNEGTYGHCSQYQKLKELLEAPESFNDQLLSFLSNTEDCNTLKDIDTIRRQLESKQEEIKNIEFMIQLTTEHVKDLRPFIPNSSNNQQPKDIKKLTKDEITQANLAKLEHEIEFLKDIEQQNDNLLLYARKMSVGFIGQYLKTLFRDSDELREYVHPNFLFRESITNIINIRSKVIMHCMSHHSDALVEEASKKSLLPW